MTTTKIIITTGNKTTIEIEDNTPQFLPDPSINTPVREYTNPCVNCPNNPINNPFASGFCNCALPALSNPMF